MTEKSVKIDVIGTLRDTSKELIGFTIFSIIGILTLIGLFAPALGYFFESYLQKKYDCYNYPDNFAVVRKKMHSVKTVLWIVAIISWITAYIYNVQFWGYIPGFKNSESWSTTMWIKEHFPYHE